MTWRIKEREGVGLSRCSHSWSCGQASRISGVPMTKTGELGSAVDLNVR